MEEEAKTGEKRELFFRSPTFNRFVYPFYPLIDECNYLEVGVQGVSVDWHLRSLCVQAISPYKWLFTGSLSSWCLHSGMLSVCDCPARQGVSEDLVPAANSSCG